MSSESEKYSIQNGADSDNQAKIRFKNTFNIIFEKLSMNNDPELQELFNWIKVIYENNVINGKQNRGTIVVKAYELMAKMLKKNITEEEKTISNILGWTLEILQACALILDDIMDGSETRRGLPCWYTKTGMLAINDAFLLEQHCFYVLRIFVSEKPYYTKIFNLFHKMSLFTTYGQFLDIKSEVNHNKRKFKDFTNSRLETVYKYKTSYYTFVFPIRIAMILHSLDSYEDLEQSDRILLKIGHLFQMQDDFLDCFGDPKITGKVGTDIADGKCCWPIVTALQLSDERQIQILQNNYGIKCEVNISTVKAIYEALDLINVFEVKTNEIYCNIRTDIQKLKDNSNLCPEIYEYILKMVYRRNK